MLRRNFIKVLGVLPFINFDPYVGYVWKLERLGLSRIYNCYYRGKLIGFIPIGYPVNLDWDSWWRQAYERHENLTLRILMNEIMDDHISTR